VRSTGFARLVDRAAIGAIERFLADRPVVIATDITATRLRSPIATSAAPRARATGRDAPHEWMLVYLANAFAPGSLLLPIHRLVLKGGAADRRGIARAAPGLGVPLGSDRAGGPAPRSARAPPRAFARQARVRADDASGKLRIFMRPRGDGELTVRVIHREVIEGVFGLDEAAVRGGAIAYPKSALQTARDLRAGRGAVALYLNALTPEDVFRVTGAGEVLPQKSTFFMPKLPSGLVFRPLDGA
jgi:hypothetical protein